MKHLFPRDNEWDIYRTGNDDSMIFVGTIPDTEVDYLIDKWRFYGVECIIHADRRELD